MPPQQPLRVLLVDDHDLFRLGMRELLEEEGFEVADANSAAAALRRLPGFAADVVLMDINMPEMSGIEATREVRRRSPAPNVLMLTVAQDDERVLDAVVAGACGYLLKDADLDDIIAGIRCAAAGQSVVAPRVAGSLLSRVRAAEQAPDDNTDADGIRQKLTERECEVLGLLSQGLENTEISKRLFISPSTVKTQVSSIFEKLGVENRVQAAVYAIRNGLDGAPRD